MNCFLKSTCVVLLISVCSLSAQEHKEVNKAQVVTVSKSITINNPPSVVVTTGTSTDASHPLPSNVISKNANYYRVNKGPKGIYFVIQDFYTTGEKRTDPYLVTDLDRVINDHFDIVDYDRFPINGLLIIWFKNGLVQQKGVFNLDGKRKGLWVSWYEGGQKKTSGHYKNNLKEGAWTVWYQNGRRMQKGYYHEDNKEGVWIYWYGNGKKKEAGRYSQGLRVERWSFWDDSGQLVKSKEIREIEGDSISSDFR